MKALLHSTSLSKHRVALLAGLSLAAWLNGCAVAKISEAHAQDSRRAEVECAPASTTTMPLPGPSLPPAQVLADTLLRGHFTPAALEAANRYGLLPALHRLAAAPVGSLTRLGERQRVSEQLAALALAVSSTAAELDCEEERADQIADYLLDRAGSRVRTFTLLSILLGALGTVVTGVMSLLEVRKTLYRPIGIAFGLAGATLGLLTLRTSETTVDFRHRRNALAAIGRGPAAAPVFPAAVWVHLTQASSHRPEVLSPRQTLLQRWQTTGELGAKDAADKERLLHLLFGPGGTYKASELRIRANFYDQLESSVALMKPDVFLLSQQVATLP
ncbi:hypothetical protein [Hymenobacter profundi]|uniref:Uncharacterized protein n=1 Tax=Hymenobacter profundi TaxID=1982110 RepID=A0ABS6WUC2_9BACT|nr:hypothetical protein [Hymenobacter profundi]MBW3127162.1 hypothetical protein [Hymenobacter profundi]